MTDLTDRQLLLDHAAGRGEAAFTEIVRRYRDFVYSAARRQVSAADAAEVAQGVFIDLAAKAAPVAARLAGDASLAGWLHRATRFAALKQLRAAQRRVAHETQAMHELSNADDRAPDWAHIQPLLDEAIDGLADDDREALLLRFFNNHDFRTVGRALGVSDDTAQKRVSRALDRLRAFFLRRGVTVSAVALGAALTDHAVQAAPAGFAVSLASIAKITAGTTAGATATVTTTSLIAMTTLQKGLVVAAAAIAAFVGVSVYRSDDSASSASAPKPPASDQVHALHARIASLATALEQARKTNEQTIAERDSARRAAVIFKELADRKDGPAGVEPAVPTHRHYLQGMGQIAAYYSTARRLDRSVLSEDEKLALQEDELKMGLSALKLQRAAKAKGLDSDDPAAAINLNQPDNVVCFLNGSLELSQDQFAQVYALVSQFNTPGLPVIPKDADITAERMAVVKRRRAELDRQIEPLLTPAQLNRFKAIQNDVHIINPYDGSVSLGYTMPKE